MCKALVERSDRLDTALYKNHLYLYFFYVATKGQLQKVYSYNIYYTIIMYINGGITFNNRYIKRSIMINNSVVLYSTLKPSYIICTYVYKM